MLALIKQVLQIYQLNVCTTFCKKTQVSSVLWGDQIRENLIKGDQIRGGTKSAVTPVEEQMSMTWLRKH